MHDWTLFLCGAAFGLQLGNLIRYAVRKVVLHGH